MQVDGPFTFNDSPFQSTEASPEVAFNIYSYYLLCIVIYYVLYIIVICWPAFLYSLLYATLKRETVFYLFLNFSHIEMSHHLLTKVLPFPECILCVRLWAKVLWAWSYFDSSQQSYEVNYHNPNFTAGKWQPNKSLWISVEFILGQCKYSSFWFMLVKTWDMFSLVLISLYRPGKQRCPERRYRLQHNRQTTLFWIWS